MRISPSAVSSSDTTEASLTSPEPVNPAPCHASASPMPRRDRGRRPVRSGEPGTVPEPARSAAVARGPRPQPLELAGLGGALEDLLAGDAVAQDLAGRASCRRAGRRSAGGSRAGDSPSASAIRLRWVSAANSVCGAPNPRNAPLGGVFVRVARARMRTFGHAVRAASVDRAAATGRPA